MNKIFLWIKKHVRSTISYDKNENNNDVKMKWKDRIIDIRKKSRIGIKIGFKF